jgi:hypothetical protein
MAAGYLWACRQQGRPCRVLATGFTREAIGNLLEDLADIVARDLPGVPVLYFGNPPDQPLPAGVEEVSLSNEELKAARARLADQNFFAGATTWSLYKLFKGGGGPEGDGPTARVFDLVLINEASQMLVSQGLMALSGLTRDGRVVVAGDDRQLPRAGCPGGGPREAGGEPVPALPGAGGGAQPAGSRAGGCRATQPG